MRDVDAEGDEEPSDTEMGEFFSDNSDSDSQGTVGSGFWCEGDL
jgi:hypothetical protein